MNKDEIIQYNKNIHSFLGYNETSSDQDFYFVEHPETKDLRELNFNRKYVEDWNCIMDVVEAIEKNHAWVKIRGQAVDISTIANTCAATKKEATVQAINNFLIWYKTDKDDRQ